MGRQLSSRVVNTAVIGLAVAGCCPKPPVHSVNGMTKVEQLGTFGVDATAVSRWQDVAAGLQPTFKLTPEEAVLAVSPVTSYEDVLRARATSVALGLGVGTVTSETNSLTQVDTLPLDAATLKPVQPGTGSQVKTAVGTQTLSMVPTPTPTLPTPTSELPAAAGERPLGLEPGHRYELAFALLERVSLLNRQIRDAVVEEGLTPYVVTVKLSSQPIRQDLPLNTYFDLVFAVATEIPSPKPKTPAAAKPAGTDKERAIETGIGPLLQSLGQQPQQQQQKMQMTLYTGFSVETPPTPSPPTPTPPSPPPPPPAPDETNYQPNVTPPMVLPLLNYDSVESQARSFSQAEIDSAAFSLAARLKAVGVQFDISQLREELRRTFGRRQNSLLNIVKLNRNTVRVRLGAAFSPRDSDDKKKVVAPDDAVMLAREHTVSFIVLVPNTALLHGGTVAVMGRPHMRFVSNGLRLGTGQDADTNATASATIQKDLGRLQKLAGVNTAASTPSTSDAATVGRYAYAGELGDFLKAVQGVLTGNASEPPKLDFGDYSVRQAVGGLWLAGVGGYDGPILSSLFQIPRARLGQWPHLEKDVTPPPMLVTDDKRTVLSLFNGVNLNYLENATASLSVTVNGVTTHLPAASVSTPPRGNALQAVFPKLTTPDGVVPAIEAKIDFDAPVPVDAKYWKWLRALNRSGNWPTPEDVNTVLTDLERLDNGRFRIKVKELSAVPAIPAPPAQQAKLEVTADQTVIRTTREATSTLTLRVGRLPTDAATKPVYFRLKNASFKLPGGTTSAVAKQESDGRWTFRAVGEVTLEVSNAVPASPVIVETYRVTDGKEEENTIQAAISVSP